MMGGVELDLREAQLASYLSHPNIARVLRFPWFLAYGFIIIPPFIRDFFYKIIANNRYRWFGQKETCRIPTPEEIARFLLE